MSERSIQVGDLVQVVRTRHCPCPTQILGMVFVVSRFSTKERHCPYCKTRLGVIEIAAGLPSNSTVETWRLKRIPPLSELESTKTKEEITA